MATITFDADTLRVNLSPADKFWAFHGSLAIPLTHVASVTVRDEDGWKLFFNKIAGSSLPGVKMAGTFLTREGWTFCDFSDGHNCIEIETHHERFAKIIIQLDATQNPQTIATEIQQRIAKA